MLAHEFRSPNEGLNSMTSLAVPATRSTTDVAVDVKAWAKPVPVAGAVAGEAGVQTRVDVGPASLESRLVGYAQLGADKVLVRGEKSAAVEAGPVEVAGRVRGT